MFSKKAVMIKNEKMEVRKIHWQTIQTETHPRSRLYRLAYLHL